MIQQLHGMTLQIHQRLHRSILTIVKQIIDLLLWLSLKRGFNGCRHRFGGFDGFSGLDEFNGFDGFSRFNGFGRQSRLSFKGFAVSFTLLLKVLFLLLSYPLSYTWLKGEPQVSRKEKFFLRYLQYGVLGDCIDYS